MTHVNVDEYVGDEPAFARVRARGAPPAVVPRVVGYSFASFGGIPVITKGHATVTYHYKVELQCDVCGRKIADNHVYLGKPGEVPRTEAERMMAALKRVRQSVAAGREAEWPARDEETVKNLAREINVARHFRFQCPKCGRWVGRGREHASCADERWGFCRFCGGTMERLFEKQTGQSRVW